jgi:hypothetical protein
MKTLLANSDIVVKIYLMHLHSALHGTFLEKRFNMTSKKVSRVRKPVASRHSSIKVEDLNQNMLIQAKIYHKKLMHIFDSMLPQDSNPS